MNAEEVSDILTTAANLLLEHQPTLFLFTSPTNQTEWNIAHHLANEMAHSFDGFHRHVDVAKPEILETEGQTSLSTGAEPTKKTFLVVEVKRHKRDIKSNLDKEINPSRLNNRRSIRFRGSCRD